MLVSLSALGTVAAARGHGEPPARFELQSGGAWVASSSVGLVTLIDGASAQVAARVDVADPPSDLAVAQRGGTAYTIDRRSGGVTRVDPTTFAVGAPVAVIDGARGRMSLQPTDDTLYVLDKERGRLAVTDPDRTAGVRSAPVSLAQPVMASVVDDQGRLWLLGTNGDITWFDGLERHDRAAAVADPGSAALVAVGGRAVLVERSERQATVLGEHGPGERVCVEVDTGDASARFAGSAHRDRIYVVSGDDGVLRLSELATGDCGTTAIAVADPGDRLGAPAEVAGRVFMPDFTTGTVAIIDLTTGDTRHTDRLVPAGTVFELFGRDGIAFYNDPRSERAGVVHVDGTFTAVAKYDPANPRAGVEPPDGRDPPAVGDDGELADPPNQPDGPSSPTTTDPPGTDPPPDPTGARPPRPDERPPAGPPRPGGRTTSSSGTGSTTTTTTTTTTPTPTDTTASTPPPPPPGTPPVVELPDAHLVAFPDGRPCPLDQRLCQLEITVGAADPEDGITDLRLFEVTSWVCSNGVESVTYTEGEPGSPLQIDRQSGGSAQSVRLIGCDVTAPGPPPPPPGSTLVVVNAEVFAVATNGIGLQAEGPHAFVGLDLS